MLPNPESSLRGLGRRELFQCAQVARLRCRARPYTMCYPVSRADQALGQGEGVWPVPHLSFTFQPLYYLPYTML